MMPRNCNFCGLCCTLVVKVTEKEVKRIESLGHDRRDFTERDEGGNTILKRNNGWCTFFERRNNIGYCKVYDKRPGPCSNFPGKKLCDLKDNPIYKDWKNKHPNVKLLWDKAPKKTDPLPEEPPAFPEN